MSTGLVSPRVAHVTQCCSPGLCGGLALPARGAGGVLEKYKRLPRQCHQLGEEGAFSHGRSVPAVVVLRPHPDEEDK